MEKEKNMIIMMVNQKIEGNYLNGERWNGKKKEYNYNGKLLFEGEYLKGERLK